MSRRIRTGLTIVGVGLLLATLLAGYAMRAVHTVQPFYQAALEADPQVLEGASRELESRVAALYSDAVQQQSWQAVFSETEVNGWLAVALADKYAELLPETVVEPRVAFNEGSFQIGYRYHNERISTVLSVHASAFVSDSDEIAIRFLAAHAGALPLPLVKIVEPLSKFAREHELPLRWSQQAGDPVALMPLQELLPADAEQRQLETIELHKGELVLAGKTVASKANLAQKLEDTVER